MKTMTLPSCIHWEEFGGIFAGVNILTANARLRIGSLLEPAIAYFCNSTMAAPMPRPTFM